MNATEFLHRINQNRLNFLRTEEMASILGISTHLAGKYLEALRKKHFLEKISRGKWAVKGPALDPLAVAEFITAPKESYVSLHSALFHHGMIEQVPGRIYAVTVDRSKVVKTPLGIFSFHHCDPRFFVGYDYLKPFLKIATPEKALVDYFYFSPTKTRQFTHLPELEIPASFSWKRVADFCRLIPSPRTKTLVSSRVDELRRRMKKLRAR